jgi:hypothetical protein
MNIDTLRAPGHAEPIDPTAETVINGAPYVMHKSPGAGTESSIDQAHGVLSDEVKRRQIALAVRYVTVLGSATR